MKKQFCQSDDHPYGWVIRVGHLSDPLALRRNGRRDHDSMFFLAPGSIEADIRASLVIWNAVHGRFDRAPQ